METMMSKFFHLEVPYFYHGQVLMPRARNPVKQIFKGSVGIGIRKLETGDAPVVFRIQADGYPRSGFERPMVDWRWDGNNLYEAINKWERTEKGVLDFLTPTTLETMTANKIQDYMHPFSNVGNAPRYNEDSLFKHEVGYRTEVDDLQKIEDDIQNDIKAIAGSLRVIDGKIYERRLEPLLRPRHERGYSTIDIQMTDPKNRSLIWWSGHYRLDEYEILKREYLGRRNEGEFFGRKVEVIAPDVLTANPAKAAILQETIKMIFNLFGEIGKYPARLVAAFVDLRDELNYNRNIPGNVFTRVGDPSNKHIEINHYNNYNQIDWMRSLAFDRSMEDLPQSLFDKIRAFIDAAIEVKYDVIEIDSIIDLFERYENYRDQNQHSQITRRRP
jgi:hypothetical protein